MTELEPELLLPVVERDFVPLLVLGFVSLEVEELVVGCDVVVSRLDGLGLSADAVVSSSFFVAEGAVWPTFRELLSGAFMEVDVVLAVLALLVERAEDSRDVVLRRDESRDSFWAREAEEEVVRLVLLGSLFEDVAVEAVAAGAVVSRSRDGGLGELEERFALYRDWTTFTRRFCPPSADTSLMFEMLVSVVSRHEMSAGWPSSAIEGSFRNEKSLSTTPWPSRSPISNVQF